MTTPGGGTRPTRRLIVTADDFGLCEAVNEAVERAHREGILSAASLMIGAPAAADAIARARRSPGLRVGLHLVVVEGLPVLPPALLPALVDAQGELPVALFATGVRYFVSPRARRQLAAEIRAQVEAYRATGLALDHVNAHEHFHLHPTVWGLLCRALREHGMAHPRLGVRIPVEPPFVSWRATGGRRATRAAVRAGLAPFAAWLRASARRAGLRTNDQVFGLYDSGRMDEARVLGVIAALPPGSSELYLHPATGRAPALDRFMADYRHADELAALLSPRVRAAVAAAGLAPCGYSDL